ncbi:MAG TPA: TonB-dependent receptor [Bradyrhizobium sp.]|nr:TonB-dependent receptor [Bradyrhizobium sp.]
MAVVVSLVLCGSANADDSYQLGHGYDVGPLNFAGYAVVGAEIPNHGQKAVTAEDLSLFVTGHIAKYFNPFLEAELYHFNIAQSGSSGSENSSSSLTLERLYNDVDISESFTVRLGKMLAPVGAWNEIHAVPLVLTTVRPAVTIRNFSDHLTGLSLIYNDRDSSLPELKVYWQPDRELSDKPNNTPSDKYIMVEGLHLSYPISLLDQVGFSFQKSRDTQGVNQSLFGLDFHKTIDKLTLQGEATISGLSGRVRQTEWGSYLAASYALSDQWSAYSWYEQFADRSATSVSHDVLFGITYRPHPAIAFKVEYLQNFGGTPVNPSGLFASWSVLF